jgi:hypothetical protein
LSSQLFSDKHVLITGASSGIGQALARQFAKARSRVTLVARRAGRLAALADELQADGAACAMVADDLVEPAAAERVLAEARGAFGPIDVLVNNAGIGDYGPFAEKNLDDLERVVRLNVLALMRLTHLALPDMLSSRAGHILNVASTAAFQPTPHIAVYGASKAFVLSFSMSLWDELRKTGVRVTCVCPGPVKTEFFDRGGYEARKIDWVRLGFEPNRLAELIMARIAAGRCLYVPGILNKIGTFAQRLAPLPLVTRISGRILRPGKSESQRP